MSTVVTGAENGTRAVVMGCACVIFSSLTPDEIKRFKALHPEALKMEKEKAGASFYIDLDDGPGKLVPEGAVYSRITSDAGKATITIVIDPDVDDPLHLTREKLAGPLMNLIELEKHLTELLPQLEEEEKTVSQLITRM